MVILLKGAVGQYKNRVQAHSAWWGFLTWFGYIARCESIPFSTACFQDFSYKLSCAEPVFFEGPVHWNNRRFWGNVALPLRGCIHRSFQQRAPHPEWDKTPRLGEFSWVNGPFFRQFCSKEKRFLFPSFSSIIVTCALRHMAWPPF